MGGRAGRRALGDRPDLRRLATVARVARWAVRHHGAAPDAWQTITPRFDDRGRLAGYGGNPERQVEALGPDQVDGSLLPSARLPIVAEITAHLDRCPKCLDYRAAIAGIGDAELLGITIVFQALADPRKREGLRAVRMDVRVARSVLARIGWSLGSDLVPVRDRGGQGREQRQRLLPVDPAGNPIRWHSLIVQLRHCAPDLTDRYDTVWDSPDSRQPARLAARPPVWRAAIMAAVADAAVKQAPARPAVVSGALEYLAVLHDEAELAGRALASRILSNPVVTSRVYRDVGRSRLTRDREAILERLLPMFADIRAAGASEMEAARRLQRKDKAAQAEFPSPGALVEAMRRYRRRD